MSLKKRLLAVTMVLVCFGLVLTAGLLNMKVPAKEETSGGLITTKKDTIYLWYTDDTITDFLNSAAVSFGDMHDVRIIPVLKSSTEYLEQINKASLNDEEATPDLYIMSNDSLGKAYLAGLADKVRNTDGLTVDNYPQTALDACTYTGDLVAYPYYFDTSAYLYNKTFLEDWVKSLISAERAEAAKANGEAASTEGSSESTSTENSSSESSSSEGTETEEVVEEVFDPAEVEARLEEILPDTMEELLSFGDSYDAPPTVEFILKWDVSDVFYNYYFVGNYMNVGGPTGDDLNDINIYNSQAIECLETYQTLNQFFSIDADTVSYEEVINDFIAGKSVFSVVSNDAIAKLNAAKVRGEFEYEYGIMNVPAISDTLKGRSLSVTNVVAVNGYSENKTLANDFAEFLTGEYTQNLYARTGKTASRYQSEYEDKRLEVFMSEYERSISMPKMIETSNYWIKLEVLFANIWNGGNIDNLVRDLASDISKQINREADTE